MPQCDHAAFRVANLERSLRFYQDLLPARLLERRQHRDFWRSEIAKLEPEGQPGFLLVLIMPRRVRFLLWFLHHWVPRQARSHEHLGFRCTSQAELEGRATKARELGYKFENPITKLQGREAFVLEVLDPDRNGVEWTFGDVHGS